MPRRAGVAAMSDAIRAGTMVRTPSRAEARVAHAFVSTRVQRGWFDPATSQIGVQFRDGTMWVYDDCTMRTWQNFVNSASPGRFVHEILDSHPNRRA